MDKEVEHIYDCPFMGKFPVNDHSGGWFDDTCNLMDGDACLKETCPLIKDKVITVTWIGDA